MIRITVLEPHRRDNLEFRNAKEKPSLMGEISRDPYERSKT
jgi:hypothetical protein